LTFPNGESVTFQNVLPSVFSDPAALNAMGIPSPDYVVEGTAGADTIDGSYQGDPDGDMVDANDHSDGSNNDSIDAGAGDDSVVANAGDDTILGGDGNDTIQGGDGADSISGDDFLASPVFTVQFIDINGLTDNTEATTLDTYFDLTDGSIDVSSGDTAPSGATFQVNPLGTTTTDSLDPEVQAQSSPTGIGYGDTSGHAMVYSTQIEVEGGTYSFDASFYNSAALYIDGQQVFLSESLGANTASGSIALTAGTHDVTILYAKDQVGAETQDLNMSISGGEFGSNPIPFEESHAFGIGAGTGDDSIDGGAGKDTIDGGVGNDSIDGGTDSDVIFGGDGNDTIVDTGGTGSHDTIDGGAGNDSIDGGQGDDLIYGGDGADTINSGANFDTVFGNAGDDVITGGTSSDYIDGGWDNDLITDTGGTGSHDTLLGNSGIDTIDGGLGDDSIDGGSDGDLLLGGDGNDTITDTGGVLSHDTIDGGAGADSIDAGAGNDSIDGGDGSDLIFGGDGKDSIDGGLGGDVLTGGAGNDVFI
ncbi:MAG: calcium-binding protein, partial [Albidovulum sp.]